MKSEIKSTGALFIRYLCKIIEGISSYLHDNYNKKIAELFSYATGLFNALGSWVYGERNLKVVYPYLRSFLDYANNINVDNFSYLLKYINYIGDDLLNLLKENQIIEHNFYDTSNVKHCEEEMVGILLMWRLGRLIIDIIETSESNNVPILFESFIGFDGIFDAFGKWIFADYDINTISESLEKFEEALVYK